MAGHSRKAPRTFEEGREVQEACVALAPENDFAWHQFVGKIEALVRLYPVVQLVKTSNLLHLRPIDSGFPILIARDSNGSIIPSFASWYDEFDDPEIVLELVEKALTGTIRTREEIINGKLRSCAVELKTPGSGWHEIAEMHFFIWSFLRRKVDVGYRSYTS